jgi:predicted ATPase
MYRFDPSALRYPSLLSQELDRNGKGLPTLLAKLTLRERQAFDRIEGDFRRKFPFYSAIQIDNTRVIETTGSGGVIAELKRDAYLLQFRTKYGGVLPSQSVSDGVMLSLAFLAVGHLPNPPRILLVEEPENGVHYTSLKDIVDTLRHLSDEEGVQVIVTTHSPYLLDLVQPEEVRVFSKDSEGAVHAINMGTVKDIDKMRKHFMTGEIWTSFSEERLVPEGGAKK